MRAVVIEKFGGIDELKLVEVPVPSIKDNEVLIEVHATAVNPVDCKIREGKLQQRLPNVLPIILGWDAAGIIKEVGKNVREFQQGDKVYTYARKPEIHAGTYAEFVAVAAVNVAPMPKNLTFAQASAIPLVTLTAWQALFDILKLQSGEKILIHAGAGGVGGMAIQLAKYVGAYVITTAREHNYSYVTDLGADLVIDHSKDDFVDILNKHFPSGVDAAFDTVGGETYRKSFAVLKAGGRVASLLEHPDPAVTPINNISAHYLFVTPSGQQLREIAVLFENYKLVPLAITAMPLEEAKLAHMQIASQHNRGKIVLHVQ